MYSNNNELILTPDSFLLSETDEKGIIRYANDEFCKFAEYSLDELIGKPHSIVRHVDMPEDAFKEMWKKLKSGETWKGFVKNKTRTGKFYWVFTTILPFISSDGNKGFMSCKRMASKNEIEKYESKYTQMN